MTIRIGRLDLSPSRRKAVWSDGGKVALHKTMLLEPDAARAITPNAFLVEQAANTTIRPHFHTNSQWQVFVGGSGSLGRTPVQGFVAQYVAAHTGYGPIVAGEHGLWYLTLRPSAASGARYLPDARAELDTAAPKRQLHSEQTHARAEPDGETSVHPMIAPQPDGLAAWMVHVPVGGCMPAPEHPGGLARYYVVAAGEMVADGVSLGPLSTVWAEGARINLPLQAANRCALSVIALQFPANAL